MTEPCDKGPLILSIIEEVRISRSDMNHKLNTIHEVLSAVAVQKGRVDTQEGKLNDLERRVRIIERIPLRVLVALFGLVGSLVVGWGIYLIKLKG